MGAEELIGKNLVFVFPILQVAISFDRFLPIHEPMNSLHVRCTLIHTQINKYLHITHYHVT